MNSNGNSNYSGELVVLIMAGGSGTRFWPFSDQEKPKQFLNLFGEETMLQHTYKRVENLTPADRVLVLTNQRYVEIVQEQLPQIPVENIIGEPVPRDTAGAIALGALLCEHRFGNCPMVVLAADHLIYPVNVFQQNVLSAVGTVAAAPDGEGDLYTFGIVPSYPATGYGYLACGPKIKADDGIEHYQVMQFKEKPDRETAQFYLLAGNYFWNSGMFVWNTKAILKEIRNHLPEHLNRLEKVIKAAGIANGEELYRAFSALPKISIDYGVMEKAERVSLVKAQFQWDDIGSWTAVADYLEKDEKGNTIRGRGRVFDAEENIVFCADEEETVALVGVRNLVVVRHGDKTLVVERSRVEDVKKLVEEMHQ